jgi:methionyl-tRNA formyltransferase
MIRPTRESGSDQSLNFAILAGAGDPLTGYYLRAMSARGLRSAAVIVDEKAITVKDLTIFEERTEGRLPPLPYSDAFQTPFHFVANHNGSDTFELVRKLGVSFLVSAGTPRILKSPMLTVTPLGVLNCHPGLLPAFRGCSCVEWAIYQDEPVGVSVHRMSEGIDEGPILLRRTIEIEPSDHYADVRVKVYLGACDALAEATHGLATAQLDDADFAPQQGGRYFAPMDLNKLETVKKKLLDGRYAYYRTAQS